jgi:hypothetical protein
MKNKILFIMSLLLTACQVAPLKSGAEKVVLMEEVAPNCKELAKIEDNDWWGGNLETIKRKLKNRTLALGGNAVTIEQVHSFDRMRTTAIAWSCPINR